MDDVIAALLVTEGFTTVEELAFTPPDELAAIEGFDDNVAEELIRRAETFITRRDTELTEKRVELGVSDEIAAIEVLTPAMLVALGEKDVKTLDDLADLASDELIEIVGADNMDEATANDVIMAARAHWFDGEARLPGGWRGAAGGASRLRRQRARARRRRGRRAGDRPAAPLRRHARAAAEGADDPLRRRPGPRPWCPI